MSKISEIKKYIKVAQNQTLEKVKTLIAESKVPPIEPVVSESDLAGSSLIVSHLVRDENGYVSCCGG